MNIILPSLYRDIPTVNSEFTVDRLLATLLHLNIITRGEYDTMVNITESYNDVRQYFDILKTGNKE